MSKSGLVHCLLLQPFMKIQKLLKLRRFQKVKFSNGYTSKIRHNCCFNQKYCLIFLSMGFINMHFSVLLKLYNSQTFSLSLVLQHKTPIGAMFTLHVLILFFLFIIFCYLLFTVFYLFFYFRWLRLGVLCRKPFFLQQVPIKFRWELLDHFTLL